MEEEEGGGALTRFYCKSTGGLKEAGEEEGEDAWESQHCCRVNGALLSREPFSGFPEVPAPSHPPTSRSL